VSETTKAPATFFGRMRWLLVGIVIGTCGTATSATEVSYGLRSGDIATVNGTAIECAVDGKVIYCGHRRSRYSVAVSGRRVFVLRGEDVIFRRG
jgi:hypothetical protein